MQQPKHPPQYASDRELAAIYSVSPVTVWRWSRSGRIPAPLRLGPNTSRWDLAEVEAALAKAAADDAAAKTPGWIAAKAAAAAKRAADAEGEASLAKAAAAEGGE